MEIFNILCYLLEIVLLVVLIILALRCIKLVNNANNFIIDVKQKLDSFDPIFVYIKNVTDFINNIPNCINNFINRTLSIFRKG